MSLIIGILVFGYLISSLLSGLNLSHLNVSIKKGLPPEVSDLFNAQNVAQIADYTGAKTKFEYWSELVSVAVVIILFAAGLVTQITLWADGLNIVPLLQGLAVMFALLLIGYLSGIPAFLYSDFKLEKKFGFSTITVKTWLGDQAKGLLVSGVLMGLLFAGFYLFINWLGTLWWLAAWGLVVAFSFLMIFLAPVVLLPLFNKFVPLEDEELKNKILDMAKAAEFPLAGVCQMDASKRSTHDNAYFTGMGKTRRIVFYDTMVRNYSHQELLSVMGHEIGHWKMKHIFKLIAAVSAISGVLLFLSSLILAHPWIYRAVGLSGLFEKTGFNGALIGVALYVVAILFEPLNLFLSPLMNWQSRKYEYQSDAYALKLNPSADDLKGALIKLSQKNLSNLFPHPLYVIFHYSHPPLLARLKAIDEVGKRP
ncbi:M48 family metallopeptidase [candidate division TA06 bacterium]|uniref:M48 family metallopeptidase n=1 Tax=candidate division TA06 bacterium TaxID=2250710 RepID=A0A933MJB2_UNCT6|nr:M48 family metallopeptidase [candidate division TA06 bacterium]